MEPKLFITPMILMLVMRTVEPKSLDVRNCFGYEADSTHFLNEPVSNLTKATIADGQRAFSVKLIKGLFEKDGEDRDVFHNIFISPSSIFQTLMLAYLGSRGQTEAEIAQTMGLGDEVGRPEVIKNYLYDRAYQAIREQDPNLGYKLNHVNKLYFDRSLPLNRCLDLVLQDELEALDFTNSKKAVSIINSCVKRETDNKIRDLLLPGSLDGGTKVALVNAAYFKGDWKSKFEKSETKRNNFYVLRDTIRVTEFMEQKGKFNYYTSEELRAHVLEMPYVGDDISMIVILPPWEDNSLQETVSRLNPDNLKGVMAEIRSGFYSVDDLKVKIPKFKLSQTFELRPLLQKLGLKTLFDPSSDLSGFLSDEDGEGGHRDKVTLQSATHKSFVEVNEEGSEAAAATILFGFRSARPLFHKEFVADHPFMFLIYDKSTDTILFYGVYQDPKDQ